MAKVIRQFFRLTLAVLALVSVSFAVEAEEAITNFTSAIVLATDGSVAVTETITVNHSYNENQIEWFKAGSALNLIKAQVGA